MDSRMWQAPSYFSSASPVLKPDSGEYVLVVDVSAPQRPILPYLRGHRKPPQARHISRWVLVRRPKS